LYAEGFGISSGIYGKSGNGATGDGIKGEADSTNGNGISGVGKGNGGGIRAQGGGSGIIAVGQNNGHGIQSDGDGTGSGMRLGSGGGAAAVGLTVSAQGDAISAISVFGGDGFHVEGAGTGHGINARSGAGATGDGIHGIALSTDGRGMALTGNGTEPGLAIFGDENGMEITAGDTFDALRLFGGSTTGYGVRSTGGSAGGLIEGVGTNSHGLETKKTGTGIDLKATDHGDGSWEGDAKTLLLSTTINGAPTSNQEFVLSAGSADDDAYNGCLAVITDAVTANQKAIGIVSDYVGGTKTLKLLRDPGVFTFADTDKVDIIAAKELKKGQTNEGVIAAKVDTGVAPTVSTIEIKELTSEPDVDMNQADVIKNRVLTFISGALKGQSVSITDQTASAADPVKLKTTDIVNFAGISNNDEVVIT
jgi:hypothetical protein